MENVVEEKTNEVVEKGSNVVLKVLSKLAYPVVTAAGFAIGWIIRGQKDSKDAAKVVESEAEVSEDTAPESED